MTNTETVTLHHPDRRPDEICKWLAASLGARIEAHAAKTAEPHVTRAIPVWNVRGNTAWFFVLAFENPEATEIWMLPGGSFDVLTKLTANPPHMTTTWPEGTADLPVRDVIKAWATAVGGTLRHADRVKATYSLSTPEWSHPIGQEEQISKPAYWVAHVTMPDGSEATYNVTTVSNLRAVSFKQVAWGK